MSNSKTRFTEILFYPVEERWPKEQNKRWKSKERWKIAPTSARSFRNGRVLYVLSSAQVKTPADAIVRIQVRYKFRRRVIKYFYGRTFTIFSFNLYGKPGGIFIYANTTCTRRRLLEIRYNITPAWAPQQGR